MQVAVEPCVIDTVDQSFCPVPRRHKSDLLAHFVTSQSVAWDLAFTRTKHGADKLVQHLKDRGLQTAVIHSNKTHFVRQ